MIATINKSIKISGVEDMDTVSFGIKEEGLSHIFKILRCQLYSDKIYAVIREYACNSLDANTLNGCPNRPIVVTLPNSYSLEFRVRDFGKGLSQKDIGEIYANYGESTKRNSNKLIGQMGIGSKSAFAYGDNFAIESYQNGIKTIYNAYIDESEVGAISKMEESETTEEDGVEIVVSVKKNDMEEFRRKAFQTFRHFKIRPIIKGINSNDFYRQLDEYHKNTLLSDENKTWSIFGQDKSFAVMGNIGYPLDIAALDAPEYNNLISAGLQVDFKIGELDITASREALEYTTKTKTAIKKKLTSIIETITSEVVKQFQGCNTIWEAKKLFGKFFNYSTIYSKLAGLIDRKKIIWKNIPIISTEFTFTDESVVDFNMIFYSRSGRTNRLSGKVSNQIDVADNYLVLINDLGSNRGILSRIAGLFESSKCIGIYVMNFKDDAYKKFFFDKYYFESVPTQKLSTVPLVKFSNNPNLAALLKSPKSMNNIFTFNYKVGHLSKSWEVANVDLTKESGLYIILDRFQWKHDKLSFDYRTPDILNDYLNRCTSFGIDLSSQKIYGIKNKFFEANKLNFKNIKPLHDFILEEFDNMITKDNLTQKFTDRMVASEDKLHIFNYIGHISNFTSNSLFLKYVSKYNEMINKNISSKLDKFVDFCNFIGKPDLYKKTVTKTTDFSILQEKVKLKYPLISVISSFIGVYNIPSEHLNKIIDYINLIDSVNP